MAASANSPYKNNPQAVPVAYWLGEVDPVVMEDRYNIGGAACQDSIGEMLSRAMELQQHVNPGNTAYRHKTDDVAWGDNNGDYHCYTDCSGFINALINKTCHWDENEFRKVFGRKRMLAYNYFDAITGANHFLPISHINEVRPGDLIALQYADRSEHEDNTGHCMLITTFPKQRNATTIVVPGTRQFEVEVIDCSRSPHGKRDTRVLTSGEEYTGLGKGLFRLYTDLEGKIVAYSWSVRAPKAGFNPYENAVVVGRFIPNK